MQASDQMYTMVHRPYEKLRLGLQQMFTIRNNLYFPRAYIQNLFVSPYSLHSLLRCHEKTEDKGKGIRVKTRMTTIL